MEGKSKKPYCRWIHLSDLHLIDRAEDEFGRNLILYGSKGEYRSHEATNIDEGGLRWYVKENPVECIVITGDLFFKSNFCDTTKQKLKSFLSVLYQICSDASGWEWSVGKPMNRLFWCPGNHDLNREAVVLDNGTLVYRKERISKACDGGYFSPKQYRKLLTEQTFREIYEFMCELRGEDIDSGIYETQFFQVPGLVNPPVCFLAVNTALSAGQTSTEDVDAKIEKAFEDFFKYHNAHDSDRALSAYKEYHRCLQVRCRQMIKDEGNLCFVSETSANKLHSQLGEKDGCITILMGHHPYAFFDQAAQKRFLNFVTQNAIKLYLHGHTHIIQNEAPCEKQYPLLDGETSIRSVGVGGLYLNSQDNYNQLSFSVGSIVKKEDGKHEFSISLLIFSSATYSDRQWLEVITPIRCECSITHPNGSTHTTAYKRKEHMDYMTPESVFLDDENNTEEMHKLIEEDDMDNIENEDTRLNQTNEIGRKTDSDYSKEQIDRFIEMYKRRQN